MKQLQAQKAPRASGKENPDVIITRADQTTLFKAQNRRASEWLRRHYHLATGAVKGDTQIQVHPSRCKRIMEELKAAGFAVISNESEVVC
jgi:hypothetical protein